MGEPRSSPETFIHASSCQASSQRITPLKSKIIPLYFMLFLSYFLPKYHSPLKTRDRIISRGHVCGLLRPVLAFKPFGQKIIQSFFQILLRADWNEYTTVRIAEDSFRPRSSGGDDRAPAGRGLQQYLSEAFRVGRQNKDVCFF